MRGYLQEKHINKKVEKSKKYCFLRQFSTKNEFFQQKWRVFEKVTLFLHIFS